MKNPKRESFKLTKLKIPSNGGVIVDFKLIEVLGEESYESSQTQKSTKEPHPDLVDLLKRMVPMVGQIFGLTMINAVVGKKEFNADAIQIDKISKYVDQMNEKIRVGGVSLSGSEDKKGVAIAFGYRVDNNQVVGISTPKIPLSGSERGFEEELEELVKEIEIEAYNFIYEGKVYNPEMFEPAE